MPLKNTYVGCVSSARGILLETTTDQALPEGRTFWMFEGIRTLKPSAAVDMIIPGIWECQWSSFKSFCPCLWYKIWVYGRNEWKLIVRVWCSKNKRIWEEITWWTKRSCGGKSSGAFTCSFVWALNSASSSSSFSKERSHILVIEKKNGWTKNKDII